MVRILSIDDSRTVQGFLRQCFEGWSISVDLATASDGQEAVERLAAGERRPDLILLDWEMPRLDGPGTYAQLRRLGIQVPVVMLTSKNDVDDIARMLDAGVADYVMKPFTPDIIREKAATALGVSGASDGR